MGKAIKKVVKKVTKGAKKAVGALTGGLLGGSSGPTIKIPAPAPQPIPAPAASAARPDAGGQVVVGTSATKDERVSGRAAGRKTGVNPLGNLSRSSGLSI